MKMESNDWSLYFDIAKNNCTDDKNGPFSHIYLTYLPLKFSEPENWFW